MSCFIHSAISQAVRLLSSSSLPPPRRLSLSPPANPSVRPSVCLPSRWCFFFYVFSHFFHLTFLFLFFFFFGLMKREHHNFHVSNRERVPTHSPYPLSPPLDLWFFFFFFFFFYTSLPWLLRTWIRLGKSCRSAIHEEIWPDDTKILLSMSGLAREALLGPEEHRADPSTLSRLRRCCLRRGP